MTSRDIEIDAVSNDDSVMDDASVDASLDGSTSQHDAESPVKWRLAQLQIGAAGRFDSARPMLCVHGDRLSSLQYAQGLTANEIKLS